MILSIIVTIICLLLVYIADKYSEEGRNKLWVLGPIGVWSMIIYWIIRLTYEYIW
jgi:hypothetical protein